MASSVGVDTITLSRMRDTMKTGGKTFVEMRVLDYGALQQLPVMSDGRPVGIISRKDALRSIALRNELDLRRRLG